MDFKTSRASKIDGNRSKTPYHTSAASQYKRDVCDIEILRVGGYFSKSATDEFGQTYSSGTHHVFDTVVTNPTADAQEVIAQSQLFALSDGYIKSWRGAIGVTNTKTITLRVYKATPVDNSAAALALTQLGDNIVETGGGNTTVDLFEGTGFGSSANFSKGDVLIVTMQAGSSDATVSRFNSAMEIVYKN
jgi:hypothetical protein